MPGSSVTMDRRWPIRRLNRVDFPTFGRPTMAISGSEDDMACSVGNSLPFWKIAHQMMWDLSWVQMVYSWAIEKAREIENQKIGSGPKRNWLQRFLPIFLLV